MSTIVTKTYSTTCVGDLLIAINNNVVITPICEQILTDGSAFMYFYFALSLSPTEDAELDNILSTFVCPIYNNTIDSEYVDDADIGTNILWSSDKINEELTTNVDHNNLLNKGTNSHTQLDGHLSNNNNPHQVSDTQLLIRSIGTSATLDHIIDDTISAGWIEGGDITDAGSETINVAAGECLIRSATTPTADLYYVEWTAVTGLSVPTGQTRYVYVYYNGGTPQITLTTIHQTDFHQYVYLGEVHNLGGSLKIHNDHRPINDLANRTMNWVEHVFGTLVSSGENTYDPTPSSRKIAVTSGEYFDRYFIEYASTAFDSSVSGTFTTMYRDGTGDWVRTPGQTDIDNQSYDNNSGTLATMTILYYSCRYIIRGFDNSIYVLFGQAQYPTLSQAQNETPPERPEELDEHGFYIAKYCIQKSATTYSDLIIIKPQVGGTTSSSSSSDHNNLVGLQGGTANQYYHLTLSQYNGLHSNVNDPTTNEKAALAGTYGSPSASNKYVTDTDPRLGAADSLVKISATDTTSGYLGLKLVAGTNVSLVTNNSGANETLTINANITNALADSGTNGIVVRTAPTVTTARTLISPISGITISNSDGVSGNPTFALTNDLSALEGLSTTGFSVRTATDTWQLRSFVPPSSGFTITNSSGVSGNPTFILTNDLAALEGLTGTGFSVRTTADTWVQRTLIEPSAGIAISNNDGISGNPTFSLTDDLLAIEGIATTGIVKRTATNVWSAGLVDIISETSGTLSINRGGTGQVTQASAFDALSPTTTKGDIIVRNSTNNVRVPVGANNQIIVADSTQSAGVKWGSIALQHLTNVNPAIAPSQGHVLYYDTVNSRWDSLQMFSPTASRMILLQFGTINALSGTSIIATSNSDPLITEGTQLWTYNITPTSVTSKVIVQMSMSFAVSSASARIVVAIFRDNTCVGVMSDTAANNNAPQTVSFSILDTPATTSPVVYSARVGKSGGSATWYINTLPGYTTPYGGKLQANTYTIQEIT